MSLHRDNHKAYQRTKKQTMKTETEKLNMKSQNLILIAVLITCLALAWKAQAIVPAPDGGYPGL